MPAGTWHKPLGSMRNSTMTTSRSGWACLTRQAGPASFVRSDAYRLPSARRYEFVDQMVEIAIHSARQDAVEYDIRPDTAICVSSSGYPFLWGIAWRARSASWMLRDRNLLRRTIVSAS
jgi:hypothetical protein